MSLSFKEVAEILKLIDASDCDEVVLELEGVKLAVRRSTSAATSGTIASGGQPATTSSSQTQTAIPVAEAGLAHPPDSSAQESGVQVRAPMVGTVYRRPSPDKPLFVEEGGRVEAGDPLCLIEVMKLYTTIDAPVSGTVVRVAAEDGALVEFDQVILVIEPD